RHLEPLIRPGDGEVHPLPLTVVAAELEVAVVLSGAAPHPTPKGIPPVSKAGDRRRGRDRERLCTPMCESKITGTPAEFGEIRVHGPLARPASGPRHPRPVLFEARVRHRLRGRNRRPTHHGYPHHRHKPSTSQHWKTLLSDPELKARKSRHGTSKLVP